MQQNHATAIVLGASAALIVLALVTPWWTVAVSGTTPITAEPFAETSTSAQPFDGNGATDNSNAVIAGILLLSALVATVAATTLLAGRPARVQVATTLATSAGFLLLVSAVLATMWPPEGVGFWDSWSKPFGGGTATTSVYASFGWYAASLAGFLTWIGALRAWRLAAPVGDSPPDGSATPDGRYVGPDAK